MTSTRGRIIQVNCFAEYTYNNPLLDVLKTLKSTDLVAYVSKDIKSFDELLPCKATIRVFQDADEDKLAEWFESKSARYRRILMIDGLKKHKYVSTEFLYKLDEVFQVS